jgi:hypothetical protein
VETKTTPQAEAVKPPEEAVKPADKAVGPGSPETPLSFASSNAMACDDKLSSVPSPEDDEQLIDYNSSPSAWILKIIEKTWLISMRIALRTKWPVESVTSTLELFFSTQSLLKK